MHLMKIIKLFFALVGATLLSANALAGGSLYDENGFATNPENPNQYQEPTVTDGVYQIANAGNLYWFANFINQGGDNAKAQAILKNDIVANENLLSSLEFDEDGKVTNDSIFKQWTPIGTEDQKFNGTFDGAGHTISGLYFNQDASNAGLFGRSTIGGSIKNVGVVDSYIKGKNNVGGIVGHNGNCTVNNVFSTSTVEGGECVGGIAGYNEAGTIKNAYNMGAVSGNSKFAGIAGYNHGTTAHINNVYSSGTVSGPKGQYVRGLVGYNEYQNNIDKAYYNTEVFSGDAVGNVSGTNVEGKTTVELASATLPNGFSGDIWLAGSKDVVDGKLVYKFPGLNIFNSQPELVLFNVQKGSDGKDYCEIANADDLFKFAQLVNDGATGLNAKLMANICVNACGEGEKSLLEQVAELEAKDELSPESFQQWTPMSVPANVTVAFDGNGHTISGLYFNKEKSSQIGLFGQVVGDVSVSNLGVVDFYVNGNGEVGSLAGQVTGKLNIKNCYSAGSVKGVHYIGGIVGVNIDGAELKIENSYNEGSVNASSGIVGGLVGQIFNYARLTITNSYNVGAVSGTQYVGGLVGDNYTYAILTIENSYNAGTASGNSAVGGLVGANEDAFLNVSNSYNEGSVNAPAGIAGGLVGGNVFGTLKVSNSYNVGTVTASDDNAGGLVGVNEDGTLNVLNSFFLATGGVSDELGGTPKSADEFANGTVTDLLNKDQSPAVWLQGKEYPILKDNHIHYSYENGFCVCGNYEQPVQDGNGVYQISNAGELYWFADFVNNIDNAEYKNWVYQTNANAVLVNDIVVNENLLSSLEKDEDGNVANGDGFKAWNPMGYYINMGYNVYYAGTFDGNGHTVSGLYFNDSSRELVGLFGLTTGATIKNVGVVDSYFYGKNYVGGVCGYNGGGTITNCCNTGEVNGESSVGGVCGYIVGTISNCYNTGEVNGVNNVGGVCGSVGNYCAITNCYNTGEVNGDSSVGGVLGDLGQYSNIVNCYNTGVVSGNDDYVGGVCGYNRESTITNCYYLETSANTGIGKGDGGETTAKTATQFADGTVAKLLFASDTIWGQNTSTDTVPNFSGKILFKVTLTAENGTAENGLGEYNKKYEIKATANTGYHFAGWSNGSTEIKDSILVVNDTALVATFEAHSFGNWDTTLVATCAVAGLRTHACACGEVETDTIAALGHKVVTDSAVAATCTATGLTEGKHCSVCDSIFVAQQTLPALGHKIETIAGVSPTCTVAGLTEGSRCSVCGEVIKAQETIPALGHSFTNYIYNNDATTEADGTETAVCDHGCGATDIRTAEGTKLTDIAGETANAVAIYAHHNVIVVENAEADIYVYDATGRCIEMRESCPSVEIAMQREGIYIVRTGDKVQRVAVK